MSRLPTVIACACLSLAAGEAGAADIIPLAGMAASFGPGVQVLEQAGPADIVHVQVALRLRSQRELERRTASGAHFGFGELAARYLPTEAAHQAVLDWLTAQGLTIEQTHDSRLTIGVSGTASTVGAAFGVVFSHVRSEGRDWIGTHATPTVPAAFADTILAVGGLQPQRHAVPMHVFAPAAATPFYPSTFDTAYNVGTLGLKGAGTTTAVIIDTFPLKSDLKSFWATTGVAQSWSNITLIQVNPGALPPPGGEESLDTEYASSIGPASKVRVYASLDLQYTSVDNAFERVISDLKAGVRITQVSISLGGCELDVPSAMAMSDDQMFAVMQSMGATVLVSSGDSGSHQCSASANNVSFYASSPNVTAVGGTSLYLTAGGARQSESGWSASGGGVSEVFTQPAYQKKLKQYNRRAVPDVSSDADPNTGAYVVIGGKGYVLGGTSLSAPTWAGFVGLVNATRLAAGKATVGALNPSVYPLLKTSNFFDVKQGTNGGYVAGPGYDLVTGIGTPDMANLIPALAAMP